MTVVEIPAGPKVSPATLTKVAGDTVTLQYPRVGLDAGKEFLVLGLDESVALDTDADVTTVRIWGPRQAGE